MRKLNKGERLLILLDQKDYFKKQKYWYKGLINLFQQQKLSVGVYKYMFWALLFSPHLKHRDPRRAGKGHFPGLAELGSNATNIPDRTKILLGNGSCKSIPHMSIVGTWRKRASDNGSWKSISRLLSYVYLIEFDLFVSLKVYFRSLYWTKRSYTLYSSTVREPPLPDSWRLHHSAESLEEENALRPQLHF